MNSKCLGVVIVLLLCGPAATLFGQGKKKTDKDAAPRVAVILPLGAAAGQTTRVVLRGMGLEDAKEVKVLDDNGTAKIVSKGKAAVPDKNPEQVGDTQVVAEITLKAKLSGPVQITVVTPQGETKPHELLVETMLPVVKEKEPNDGFRQGQEVKLPVVVEGAIERPRDVDVYKFVGKAGQKVELEVLAARHGSPLDSILILYNAAGVQIAVNDDWGGSVDSRLEVTLPADGVYHVVLVDAHDSGSPIHVYRLRMK